MKIIHRDVFSILYDFFLRRIAMEKVHIAHSHKWKAYSVQIKYSLYSKSSELKI